MGWDGKGKGRRVKGLNEEEGRGGEGRGGDGRGGSETNHA